MSGKRSEYVSVCEKRESGLIIDLPLETDETLLLSTLYSQFPNACGLQYTIDNRLRGIRFCENRLYPPNGGWDGGTLYYCVFSTQNAATSASNEELQTKLETLTTEMQRQEKEFFIELKRQEKEFIRYRLLIDFVYIGEASAELLDPRKKPKGNPSSSNTDSTRTKNQHQPKGNPSSSNTDSTRTKNQHQTQYRKPLKEMEPELITDLTILRDGKNGISHTTKKKRSEPDFVSAVVEDVMEVITTLETEDREQELNEIVDPSVISSLKRCKTDFC